MQGEGPRPDIRGPLKRNARVPGSLDADFAITPTPRPWSIAIATVHFWVAIPLGKKVNGTLYGGGPQSFFFLHGWLYARYD